MECFAECFTDYLTAIFFVKFTHFFPVCNRIEYRLVFITWLSCLLLLNAAEGEGMETLQEIVEKLKDLNMVSRRLPLAIMIFDNGTGYLFDAMDIQKMQFGSCTQLDHLLNTLVNTAADETMGEN
jgi:hypothetical protein